MGSTDQSEDVNWIRETLEGNQEAFGKLVERHRPLLYHMACRVLKNPQEAEDVVQDGFIEAFRHLAEFKQHSRFSTWVYTIVLNRIRNLLRHSKVLRIYSLDIRRSTRDGHCVTEVMENAPSHEDSMQGKLEREAMHRAAERLPLQYQKMFSLYYFDNYSIAEIAERLKKPPVTIKVYLHRARKWIATEIQKDSAEVINANA